MLMDPRRIRLLNEASPRQGAAYVLYWAQINRRLDSNHALAYAVELAHQLDLPVLVYEGLTSDHPWANRRFHQFILEGVTGNRERAAELGLGYTFHLERSAQKRPAEDSGGAMYRVARNAAALVTDDYPGYMADRYNASVPAKIGIPYYAVDASCIVPMDALPKQHYAAYTIRPRIHKLMQDELQPLEMPQPKHRWKERNASLPMDSLHLFGAGLEPLLDSCDIDQSVPAAPQFTGGRKAALDRLQAFLEDNLRRYARHNREPSAKATSQLSPYLHFGYISSLEIALAVREHAAQHGLIANEYLEQLIVRRELAFNYARYGPPPETLKKALPDWAVKTLAKHDDDPRDYVYSREQWERAETHDPLWNATQRELLKDGIIHGYYRMYWGKKIMEWSATHQAALDTMIYLNDRYALDGRDPNTYTNILWCFGLHDRPWKERPIFGMIRYMSADGMRRKTNVDTYVQHYIQGPEQMKL